MLRHSYHSLNDNYHSEWVRTVNGIYYPLFVTASSRYPSQNDNELFILLVSYFYHFVSSNGSFFDVHCWTKGFFTGFPAAGQQEIGFFLVLFLPSCRNSRNRMNLVYFAFYNSTIFTIHIQYYHQCGCLILLFLF